MRLKQGALVLAVLFVVGYFASGLEPIAAYILGVLAAGGIMNAVRSAGERWPG
jgi:hypothetical protein